MSHYRPYNKDRYFTIFVFGNLPLLKINFFRAQKRLKGEDVYGFKIKVLTSNTPRDSPCRNYQGTFFILYVKCF